MINAFIFKCRYNYINDAMKSDSFTLGVVRLFLYLIDTRLTMAKCDLTVGKCFRQKIVTDM